MPGKKTYFVADVHLGLQIGDPEERERRFVKFLRALDASDTQALYLLGDIWDFWYEYRDVIPKYGIRVLSQLLRLVDEGVEVCFCEGNHDMWTYSFFEEAGIRKIAQPHFFEAAGKRFCVGHGDALGGAKWSYRFMLKVFHCKFLQRCFSTIHPTLAYRFGLGWSNSNRRTHLPYHFRGADEPLYQFAADVCRTHGPVDYFVFGHFHDSVDMTLPGGARLLVVKDWMDGGAPHIVFDGDSIKVCR